MSERTAPATPKFRYTAALANEIEAKWQRRWAEEGTFHTPNPTGDLSPGWDRVAGRPKLYVLDMFPYPSGAGLHVGHPLGYIGTDVYARFKRMSGFNVLHTMGYDAFGLPAEQHAVETGQHPRANTEQNIATMRRQLGAFGLGHDSRRSIATTDVPYFKWTQWIFLKIFNSWFDPEARRARPISELVAEFESGAREPLGPENPLGKMWGELSELERRRVVDSYRLAYVAEAPVNWCPALGTVLANEEVTAEGRSERGNHPVYKRPLRQWMLRITAYAERLLDDLDLLDWPEPIKLMQRNWIGRSEGAQVAFPLAGDPDAAIEVFTTRPDTLFGATYMVLAPEHPLVDRLTASAWPAGTPDEWRAGAATPADAVQVYRREAARKSDVERQVETREKTGVFTGSYAVNPTNDEEIPVFIADYVLMGYGTGAIMAVPAHDERDFEFAQRFRLPIPAVVRPPSTWLEQRRVDETTPAASWPEAYVGEGMGMASSNPDVSLDGLPTPEAKRVIIEWLESTRKGARRINYKLRDWLFSRQRYWGEPFPIVFDDYDMPLALPEDQLPVELPELDDFAPRVVADDEETLPEPPLARATDWVAVALDLGEGRKTYRREVNTMPQWAGSCWYYLRYLDPTNDERLVDPEVERYWMCGVRADGSPSTGGVDLYVGGVEHAVLHLLYARFWHKVLYDLDHVSTPEPFQRLYNQGYILAPAYRDARGVYVDAHEVEERDGRFDFHGQPVEREYGKMGKSLKNSITPDEMFAEYGADTVRLYEMAMGPLDTDRPWSTQDIVGVYRLLQRLWRNLVDEESGDPRVSDAPADEETRKLLHRTIAIVRDDMEGLRFNTAIARLIELNNHLTRVVADAGTAPREVAEPLVLMLAPLGPHVGEELWERLGHTESLTYESFPEADPALLVVEEVEIPVQVDGKVRGRVTVPAGAEASAVEAAALAEPRVADLLRDRQVQRVVVVPGRLVNIVTS